MTECCCIETLHEVRIEIEYSSELTNPQEYEGGLSQILSSLVEENSKNSIKHLVKCCHSHNFVHRFFPIWAYIIAHSWK